MDIEYLVHLERENLECQLKSTIGLLCGGERMNGNLRSPANQEPGMLVLRVCIECLLHSRSYNISEPEFNMLYIYVIDS